MSGTYPDDIILDPEEQAFEDASDEFVPAPESERASLIAAAKAGRRPLSIRLDSSDIVALKQRAEREGMPYQTLLGSIVHKYVTGSLVDVNEIKKIYSQP